MGDIREAGRKAPVNHDDEGDAGIIRPREPQLTSIYWETIFGPNWQQDVQDIFRQGILWSDVLQFRAEPARHIYPGVKAPDTYYFVEQFGGPTGEDKIHVSAMTPGGQSSRHRHEHYEGREAYYLVRGKAVLLLGDDDGLKVEPLSEGVFTMVYPNTWHQVRTIKNHALLIVINYNARDVELLHSLHLNQLRDWMLLEEKPLHQNPSSNQ
ncbi:MAG: cupin domain-containing protein [Candidatus Levybacteria bacterium]|nr:cupin domain-containing protein [Candidatus Levybacteria bacterium]